MKIGFDAKRLFHNKTGLGNYSRDLIRILSTYFPESEYYLYNPKPKEINFLVQSAQVIERLYTGIPFFKSSWRSKGVVRELVRDEIKLYHGLSGEIPFGLRKKHIKSIVTIHDLIFLRYPNLYSFFDRKIHFYKFKYAAKQADAIIAISEQTKKDIVHYLKIKPDKIKVIYQGCNAVFKNQFTEDEKKAVAEKFQLPKKFILNVGTIETRKNAFTIVKAIQGTDIPLVLVGRKTAYCKAIDEYISKHQMQNQVFYLNKISQHELAMLYQLATVFVYPSVFEGFGIPIIEALFSKTPVITTNSGVFPEAGGPDSVYINPTNAPEMRNAIVQLFENEDLCATIADKGFEFVQKFNDEPIAVALNQLYQDTISKN
jgi:glycosyltransferase involved in cell wall biosynthesis